MKLIKLTPTDDDFEDTYIAVDYIGSILKQKDTDYTTVTLKNDSANILTVKETVKQIIDAIKLAERIEK